MLLRRSLTVLLVALAVVLFGSGAAQAHEGEGAITVESAQDAPDGTTFTVRVTWLNDGHPAADATVTATATDGSGVPQTPVTMAATDADGRYQAFVPFPAAGTWTIRFSVVTPTATVEVSRVVEPVATTTTEPEPVVTASTIGVDGDGNGGPLKAAVGGGVLVAIVVGAAVGFRRSTRRFDG